MSLMHREQMDCCNYFKATGNEIAIDSKSSWMQLESIEGNTTQVNTTGAQLLQDSNIYSGFLTNANGTRTNDNNYRTVWLDLPIGTYTLSVPGGAMIVKTVIDGILNNSSTSIADGAGYTCTLTQDGFLGISFRKQDSSNYTTEPQVMLNTGSTAKPWEPYTGGQPSPSPDYPQEIVNADIKSIMIKSAQMFDINNPSYTLGQWIITENKISITNPTSSYLGLKYNIDVMPNTLYTFYSIIFNDTPNVESMHVSISLLREDGTITKNNVIILNNTSSGKFTTTEDTKSIDIYFRNRTTGNGGYFKDIVLNKGSSVIPWQPYYNPQTISLTFTEPFRKVGDYADEITPTKTVSRCIEITLDGSENWRVYATNAGYEGFEAANVLPVVMTRHQGYCNQLYVSTTPNEPRKDSIWLGWNNKYITCFKSSFYNESLEDKGLSLWKAHLATNPLKIITYTNPEDYVETPLDQSNVDAIKSLYAYNGVTLLNNNENTVMKVMYKSK